MNFFKRLFGSKDNALSASKNNAAYAANNSMPKNTFTPEDDNCILKQYVQKLLYEKNIVSEIVEDNIVISILQMSIKPWISNKTKHPNALVIQINFVIKQELFDAEIVESLAGIGTDLNAAIKNGVSSFFDGVLTSIIYSFDDRHNPEVDFETEWNGNIRLWHPKIGPLQLQGKSIIKEDENKIFNLIKEDIRARVGNLQFYWVKVYVAKQVDGEIIAQCFINNEPFLAADKKLYEYAQSWNTNNQFNGKKQYIIIRQCDNTWKPSKHTKEQIKAYINSAIDLMENCTSEAEYELLFERISNLTNDEDLAYELFSLIPEIYCRITFPEVKYSDEIMLVYPDNIQKTLNLFKLSIYRHIESVALERLKENYDKDKHKNVLVLSGSFKALNDALQKNDTLEDITSGYLSLFVPENYNPLR